MPPPAVVYVVAAIVGVAAVFAFKEFVYEPHIAPTFEAWAEDFLERRRATRRRRASAVPVRTSRRCHSPPSSVSSIDDDRQRDYDESDRVLQPNDFPVDEFELEALASREVDEWRNEVLRSQARTDGLRKRRTNRLRNDFDGLDSMSTTLDESFASLTHTPLASTHVISNVSSPITPSTVSLPQTPTRRFRSESQSTTTQGDVTTLFIAPQSPQSPVREIPVVSPRASSPGSAVQTPRPPTNVGTTSPSPLAIPITDRRSPATEGVPRPLPFTPTYQVMADDSPFGPLLPDTPRSGAEMYGQRPFSPITRVMGSSSSSAADSKGTLSSSINSTSLIQTLGGSGVLRRPSALANEVVMSGSDDGSDEDDHTRTSTTSFTLANSVPGINGSTISSLSERYPAPPTPPVIISPPTSSVGIISIPPSPRSGSPEVVVHPLPQTHSSLPMLQLPPELSSPRLLSRSSTHSAMSPALSYASFLSPMPISRAVSESEGDEFLSIASDDSDWSISPVTPGGGTEPVQDRANNPFLDFEHLTHDARGNPSEHGDGSEGSEVLVAEPGLEGGSEAGSEESWGSARRH